MRRRIPSLLVALAPLAALLAGCSGGGAHDVDKLLADLTGESPRARTRAERTLAEHGRSVLKPLSNLVLLKDIEKTVNDYGIRRDPNELRIPAARALGVIADRASLAKSEAETAAAPLLEVLKPGHDRALRIEAARALGFFTQLSAPANDLVLTFREDDPGLVKAATEALARNALRAVYTLVPPKEPAAAAAEKDWDRLLERIRSTDDEIRLETVRELAASRDPRAAEILLARVADDKSRDVRYAALCHCLDIAKTGQPEGFAAKLYAQLPTTFAKDDDSRVVLLAARQINVRKPTLVATFLERVRAATVACRDKLFRDVAEGSDPGARADAIEALVLLPGEERDTLLASLLDPEAGERARVKRAAAGVLATSDSRTALDALAKAMGDDDSVVKLVAAQALGRRGHLDAVTYLVELLDNDEVKIRADAADAIGTLGPKAVPVLVRHLRQALPRLAQQQHAAAAKYTAWGIAAGLGRIAEQIGPEAAPALDAIAAAAACPDPDVRRAAVVALGQFRGPEAVAALAARLEDPDESVQWHALAAIERHGQAAVPALLAALRDPSAPPAVTALAAGALGRIADAEALKPLLDRLATAGADARPDIAWSIGELLLRHPETPLAPAARTALAALAKQGDDPDAARAARYALRKTQPLPAKPQ